MTALLILSGVALFCLGVGIFAGKCMAGSGADYRHPDPFDGIDRAANQHDANVLDLTHRLEALRGTEPHARALHPTAHQGDPAS